MTPKGDPHVSTPEIPSQSRRPRRYQRQAQGGEGSERQTSTPRVAIDWLSSRGIPAGLYQALPTGQIWSCESEAFLTPSSKKYQEVDFKSEGTRIKVGVHRIICQAFHGKPPTDPSTGETYQANHISGDTHDNSATNLEWTSRSENIIHRNEILKSDKGGGVSANHVKCPHCSKWISLAAASGRNG